MAASNLTGPTNGVDKELELAKKVLKLGSLMEKFNLFDNAGKVFKR